ncbi:hypothetical protein GJ699_30305 [Duganella sp. FT80W]|uniref:Histidine kinase/HSP90-like ATPase domain-containing protein n=1 Tax=Duganella guangzhouensis TaxID=2666084 RepID=A0A6I2LBY6_9BURK|nr:sensor histidine kinase [Duganella guangzhouensis]MRW94276.1 hypothetical protein [Duganella guangzhouensis]
MNKPLLGLVLLISCLRCWGTALPEINLHHTSWTARDGAPTMILSITQTSDGWLWLGGPTGLYRFDGMQFEQYAPAATPLLTKNVSVVNAFADDELWIGYRTGGVGVLRHGQLRNYGEREGLPNRAVWGVERDGKGRIWAATTLGMFYLEHERWISAASAWNLPVVRYKTLMRDRRGVLWAQGDNGVYFLHPGETRFSKAAVNSGLGVLFDLPDGSVVSWDAVHARLNQLTQPAHNAPARQWGTLGDPTSLLFDHRGDLWIGLQDGLEYRTSNSVTGAVPPQGLSGRHVGALFEDKEGNVWASTSAGIDRYRSKRLARLDLPEAAVGNAILADDSGGAWVGGYHVTFSESGQIRTSPFSITREGGWSKYIGSFARGEDGTRWGALYGALWQVKGTDSRKIALPDAIADIAPQALLAEPDGSLLVAAEHYGLYRHQRNGHWEAIGDTGEINAMARSDTAGLWLGGFAGQALHADGKQWRHYGPEQGLKLGILMALHLRGAHVWLGGDNGVALLEGDHFRQLGGVNGETFDGVSGIVELANGDLWLNGAAALFRIPGAEVAQFQRTPDYRVQYERLDQLDGLEGNAPRISPTPSLVLASDGMLWVVRSIGVFRLNPAARLAPLPAPPVIVKTLGAPGQDQPLRQNAQLSAGTSALQIDYTSPALAMPERVRFRYRLDGVDQQWQDVGTRRSAHYSNLEPGEYYFSVSASDYRGAWPERSTTVRFTIAPTLTQTLWFRAGCGVLLLLVAYLGYRWQINRVARQMAGRLQERVNERERIARELHDTLLQSVQSLILHVHAAVIKLPAKDATRAQLESALQQADDVVGEGRERISDLRGEDVDKLSFPDAVLAAAARLQPADAPPVRLHITGTVRQLDPVIYQEAMAIVIEALANAYCHAQASTIEVELHYGMRKFRCRVHDNGVGIAADIVSAGGREHHWGMRGMAERASRIDACLSLHSAAGSGTAWQLELPARLAYTR